MPAKLHMYVPHTIVHIRQKTANCSFYLPSYCHIYGQDKYALTCQIFPHVQITWCVSVGEVCQYICIYELADINHVTSSTAHRWQWHWQWCECWQYYWLTYNQIMSCVGHTRPKKKKKQKKKTKWQIHVFCNQRVDHETSLSTKNRMGGRENLLFLAKCTPKILTSIIL